MRIPGWLAVVVAVGCSSSAPKPTTGVAQPPPAPAGTPAATAANPPAPKLRLPPIARPLRHDVELTFDPAREDFTGKITIDLEIAQRSDVLWLHAKDLTIESAVFERGGVRTPARAFHDKEFLGLAAPLEPGTSKLAITYRGKMTRNDGTGPYPVEEQGAHYIFTQFESMDARSAFPCFDEPSFKVPWKLAIRAPSGATALANTPAESTTREPDGRVLTRFAETRPLPSYLVAFAIGPFEFVAAGSSRGGVPIRIAVPRGRTADATYAAEVTRPLLDRLEDYFGSPYPFTKLDVLAVPVFNAGAMENPGLVTFRQELMLFKPGELTISRQQTYAEVITHELGHMWFGDLVTLAWWDDTWLNEAFATWVAAKIVDGWKPAWDVPVMNVESKNMVMSQDSLDAARAIRQPIETPDDILNAFDGITYEKGHAVLDMLERWIGPDVFQRGVRQYLAKHAWGNATYADFVAAMSAAAGKDLKPAFDAFVLVPGVPVVAAELACDKGKPPTLKLAQQRYAPTGSKIDTKRAWQLPVCVTWSANQQTGRDCTLMTGETAELALTAKACPAWVMPNEGSVGYYRMQPRGVLLDKLLAAAPRHLTLPERVGLIGDVQALVGSGALQPGIALGLVGALAKDKNRHIVESSMGVVGGIDEMVPPELQPNYERLIGKLYRARARELGWVPRPGDDDNVKQLRQSLLYLAAVKGRDPVLIKEAQALVTRWLAAPAGPQRIAVIAPELVGTALVVAARNGDQALFDQLHAEARKATDRTDRTRLLQALGQFIKPALVAQALAITLTDEFELRESLGLLQGGFAERATREDAYKFMVANLDKIIAKLPEMYRPYMAYTFVALCDDRRKPEIEKVFRAKMEALEGGPRIYAQALESLSLCSASRVAQTPGVVAFLRKQ